MKYLIIILLAFSSTVIAQNKIKSNKMNTDIPEISNFPTGEENKAYAQYFIGKSYLVEQLR